MSQSLAGKTALITAAGQGMGRATAEAFVAAGATVWATDLDSAKLAGFDDANCFALDVTDADDIAGAVARTGAVDILFNCAGIVPVGAVLDCPVEEWDAAFEINVRSMFRMIQAYLPKMIDAGGGRIINMASISSSIKASANRAAYSATKAAVIGLTKSVAADYVGSGIRCNAICPGMIDTPSLADRIAALDDPAAARAGFVARHPVGRIGRPEEVAELCVYLASDGADFITGQALVIDGGITN